jgi:transcriptional regulator with XRE-family HTH domain
LDNPVEEIAIGKRLREFRESTRIPRTAFALSIGIGSERLASYEAGRVRLRYGVFKSVAENYRINPMWLATGDGPPMLDDPFDFSTVLHIPAKVPFSQAYREFLNPLCNDARRILSRAVADLLNLLGKMGDIVKNEYALIDPAVLSAAEKLIANLVKINTRALREQKKRIKVQSLAS